MEAEASRRGPAQHLDRSVDVKVVTEARGERHSTLGPAASTWQVGIQLFLRVRKRGSGSCVRQNHGFPKVSAP